MDGHTCPAPGCTRSLPPRLLMCRSHWFALPKPLRDAVWREYRPGQERDHKPSADYLDAVREAIRYLREKEAVS